MKKNLHVQNNQGHFDKRKSNAAIQKHKAKQIFWTRKEQVFGSCRGASRLSQLKTIASHAMHESQTGLQCNNREKTSISGRFEIEKSRHQRGIRLI